MFFLNTRIAVLAVLLSACNAPQQADNSDLKWGVHASARSANILNLMPNESMEVCTNSEERLEAAHDAIRQWATAMGRWGHFKVNPCNSQSDLKINLIPSQTLGLNFFTGNPGTIQISSGASGNFMRALVLHEFGHSFGLCDQYANGGGCSNHRSPRMENSEVMGSTSANKLTLTPGDIEGARKAASVIKTKANTAWKQYLDSIQTPNNVGSVYAAISSTSTAYLELLISVPAKSTNVALCLSSAASCTPGDAGIRTLRFIQTKGDRDIYEMQRLDNVQSQLAFVASYIAQSGVSNGHFRVQQQ